MMQTVRQIAKEIVAREGSFVDDPDDPGGATKYGVTIHTMRRLGLDLTGDGKVDARDVQRLDMAQAVEIFLTHYFRKPGIAQLPQPLQPSVFDMYVNAGANAVKILQRLLQAMGQDVTADGVLGPKTAQAARQAIDAVSASRRSPERSEETAYDRQILLHFAARIAVGAGTGT